MKITNITELRNQLLESFELLQKDPRRMAQATELANTAGKIVDTVKVEMQYALMKNEEPDIPFIGKTSGKPLMAHKMKLLKS